MGGAASRALQLCLLPADSSGGVVLVVESTERAAALLSRLAALPRTGPAGEVHVLIAVRQAEAGAAQGAALGGAARGAKQLNRLRGVSITLMHEVRWVLAGGSS